MKLQALVYCFLRSLGSGAVVRRLHNVTSKDSQNSKYDGSISLTPTLLCPYLNLETVPRCSEHGQKAIEEFNPRRASVREIGRVRRKVPWAERPKSGVATEAW